MAAPVGRAAALLLGFACLALSLYVFAGEVRDGEAFTFTWGQTAEERAASARANADWKLDSAADVLEGIHEYMGTYHGAEQVEWQEEYRLAYVSELQYCLEVRGLDGLYHRWGPSDRTEPGGC
jgi:hypothetical protein